VFQCTSFNSTWTFVGTKFSGSDLRVTIYNIQADKMQFPSSITYVSKNRERMQVLLWFRASKVNQKQSQSTRKLKDDERHIARGSESSCFKWPSKCWKAK
jgi:uncharacterized circularly permuted ATP-grasp superfamily protein